MTSVRTDKRSIPAVLDEAAERRVADRVAALRELQLEVARDLASLDACAHFVYRGCASIAEFGVRLGLGAAEARTLTDLGKALKAAPHLEALIRSGDVPYESAAAIGRILGSPDLVRPGDDWVRHARFDSQKDLRKRIKVRLEEHAQRTSGVVPMMVLVREEVREDFDRARVVASRKAGKALTEGQVFRRLVDTYLDLHDPLRRESATRRVGPTILRPHSRYVPREVERAVRLRAGDECEFAGCRHRIFLQMAHCRDHAGGSGREADDLILLCTVHHTLFDAGITRLIRGPPGEIVFDLAQELPGSLASGPSAGDAEVVSDCRIAALA